MEKPQPPKCNCHVSPERVKACSSCYVFNSLNEEKAYWHRMNIDMEKIMYRLLIEPQNFYLN